MKKIAKKSILKWVVLLVALIVIPGCSSSTTTPITPSASSTLTFDHLATTLNYLTLGVLVYVPNEALLDGETVPLTVQLSPPDLPVLGSSQTIHTRIAWVSLENSGDQDITLKDNLNVTIPLNEEYQPNTIYSLFKFDEDSRQWANTGRKVTVTDDTMHVTFAIDSFGTWGAFVNVPLSVEISASRTTAIAPASISLNAIIEGGAPPYSVIWYFGDASDPDSGVAVSHFYEYPMTFTPSCIVLDSLNHQASDVLDLNLQ